MFFLFFSLVMLCWVANVGLLWRGIAGYRDAGKGAMPLWLFLIGGRLVGGIGVEELTRRGDDIREFLLTGTAFVALGIAGIAALVLVFRSVVGDEDERWWQDGSPTLMLLFITGLVTFSIIWEVVQ